MSLLLRFLYFPKMLVFASRMDTIDTIEGNGKSTAVSRLPFARFDFLNPNIDANRIDRPAPP